MRITTHTAIDQTLCGTPTCVEPHRSTVTMRCASSMAADEHGLVHGGFVFGLADYAAMLAVNHPNVVLGGAEVRFTKPVRVGDELVASAYDTSPDERKHRVQVDVLLGETVVFSGVFTCFILPKHVLSQD